MKFEMDRAWNDAIALLNANREVMLIIAGVFFFLPTLAAMLLVPDMQIPSDVAPEDAQQVLIDFYSSNMWIFLLIGIVQTAGFLALQTLLNDARNPTVGEAVKSGLSGLFPYIGAQLILVFCGMSLVGLVGGITAATGLSQLATVLIVLLAPGVVYVLVKLSLMTPVIAIENLRNPIAIMRRSWQLTKGNSLWLFVFYLLLILAYLVLSIVAGLLFSLIAALLGEGIFFTIVNGIFSGVMGAVAMVVFASVIAAVHRQLAGRSSGNLADTFE